MTKKDLDNFFKRANKIIDNYEGKLEILDYEYFIISSVIFTSDINYYYLFSVFKDNKVIDKVVINDSKNYDKTFKELSIKYKTNVIYNYNDLTSTQLRYLDNIEDKNLNKEEISHLLFKRTLDIF